MKTIQNKEIAILHKFHFWLKVSFFVGFSGISIFSSCFNADLNPVEWKTKPPFKLKKKSVDSKIIMKVFTQVILVTVNLNKNNHRMDGIHYRNENKEYKHDLRQFFADCLIRINYPIIFMFIIRVRTLE